MFLRPRWQKVLSDLWKNKTRSLLTIASIAVGLLAFGVITNLYFWLNQDMIKGYQATNPATIQIRTSLIDYQMVKNLQDITGISRAEGAREFNMQALSSSGNWVGIGIQSKNYDKAQIGKVQVQEGIWPPQKNQIVFANHKLSDLNLKLGDWVTVEDSVGNKYSLQFVGIVKDQMIGTTSGGGGYFTANVQGYVDNGTLGTMEVAKKDDYNVVYLTTSGDATNASLLNEVGQRVYDRLNKQGVTISNYTTRSPKLHPNINLVNAIVGILIMLAFLVVFLSGFLITNTLQFLLNQQVQQVGIMKSVGATRRQIILIYVALISVFGILAFFVTIPLVRIMTDHLMSFLADQINFTYYGPRTTSVVLIGQIILALVVPLASAVQPIMRGTSLSVQEALSGIQQQTASNEGWIDHAVANLKGLSRPVLIAIRNVFRNKGRLILTLTTLSLGGAVFISVFNVRVSFTDYISQLTHYFLADLNITLSVPAREQEIKDLLYTNPQIKYVEAWSGGSALVINADGSEGNNVSFIAVPNTSTLIRPIMISGRWLDPRDDNAIVLSDGFTTAYPNIKVGDTITLKINNKKTNFVVVGFYKLAGQLAGLSSYVNMDYFNSLPGQVSNRAAVYRVLANGTLTGEQQKVLAGQVQSLLEANKFQVGSIVTGNHINEEAGNGFSILTMVLLILAILIALVGSIGLTGTMSMNIMERTREIGIMRSIGASDRVLFRMVLIEGLIVGWLSWLIGAALSFPISAVLSNSITLALFGSASALDFTPLGFVIWLVVVSVLSVLSSITPARSATRLTIREVLSYE